MAATAPRKGDLDESLAFYQTTSPPADLAAKRAAFAKFVAVQQRRRRPVVLVTVRRPSLSARSRTPRQPR
jgi:hypothetical protein